MPAAIPRPLYGRGEAGSHALQIEINRVLYLEEESMTRRVAFDAIQKRLMDALTRFTALPLASLSRRGGGLPLAAE